MGRLFKVQFLGPFILFAATLSAELAARALEFAPASGTLWYLNLEVFGLFQRSHAKLSGYVDLAGFQLFGIALPIFVLACVGLVVRSRLPLAISTQFAAGYAAFLLVSWQPPASTMQASLRWIAVPPGEGSVLLAAILGTTLVSGAISHWLYLRDGRSNR